MQEVNSFDRESLAKIGKGLIISALGAVLAGFVILTPELNDFIAKHDPINWSLILLTSWGAFATSIINAGKEWMKGV